MSLSNNHFYSKDKDKWFVFSNIKYRAVAPHTPLQMSFVRHFKPWFFRIDTIGEYM